MVCFGARFSEVVFSGSRANVKAIPNQRMHPISQPVETHVISDLQKNDLYIFGWFMNRLLFVSMHFEYLGKVLYILVLTPLC